MTTTKYRFIDQPRGWMGAKVPVDVPYLITRYIKLHAMTDYSPLQVSIFTEPEAAAKWLDVSFELLTPRTSRKAA